MGVFIAKFEFYAKSYPKIQIFSAEKNQEIFFAIFFVFVRRFLKDLVVEARLRCWPRFLILEVKIRFFLTFFEKKIKVQKPSDLMKKAF